MTPEDDILLADPAGKAARVTQATPALHAAPVVEAADGPDLLRAEDRLFGVEGCVGAPPTLQDARRRLAGLCADLLAGGGPEVVEVALSYSGGR